MRCAGCWANKSSRRCAPRKREDLIFAGGEGRPRAGMAEVYLTLDNSDGFFPIDFNEVVVGRRAYRDGENEYLLNGSKVRLRDVSELLAKTGLARRTYTVIGQGMVDQALAINSDERRALFEEAAGISLYRHKREDALKETRRDAPQPRTRARHPRRNRPARASTRTTGAARARLRAPLRANCRRCSARGLAITGAKARRRCSEAKEAVEAQTGVLTTRRAEMGSYNERIEAVRKQQFDLRTQVERMASRLERICTRKPKPCSVNWPCWKSARDRCNSRSIRRRAIRPRSKPQIAAQADRVTTAEAELTASWPLRDASRRHRRGAGRVGGATDAAPVDSTIAHRSADAIQKAELALDDRRNRRTQLAERRTRWRTTRPRTTRDRGTRRQTGGI